MGGGRGSIFGERNIMDWIVWKLVKKGCKGFLGFISCSVEDGQRIRCWAFGLGCEVGVEFGVLIFILFDLEINMRAWEADYWCEKGCTGHWNPPFIWRLNGWNLKEERSSSALFT